MGSVAFNFIYSVWETCAGWSDPRLWCAKGGKQHGKCKYHRCRGCYFVLLAGGIFMFICQMAAGGTAAKLTAPAACNKCARKRKEKKAVGSYVGVYLLLLLSHQHGRFISVCLSPSAENGGYLTCNECCLKRWLDYYLVILCMDLALGGAAHD